jgi:hypothetical protein
MPNTQASRRPHRPTTKAIEAVEHLSNSSTSADIVPKKRGRGRPPKNRQQQQAIPQSHVVKDSVKVLEDISKENSTVKDIEEEEEKGEEVEVEEVEAEEVEVEEVEVEEVEVEEVGVQAVEADEEGEEEGVESGEDGGNNELDKKQRYRFSDNEDRAMLNILVESKRNGEQGDNAGYKITVWHRVVKAVNDISNSKVPREKSHCQNRYDLFKRIWKLWNAHLAHTSGWGRRSDGLPIADKEKWIEHNIEYQKACNRFKTKLPPFKDELEEILGGALATGENAADIEDLLNNEIESENDLAGSENGSDSCSELSILPPITTTQTSSAPPLSTASASDGPVPKSKVKVLPLTERKRASRNAAIAASKRQKKPDGQQQLLDVLDKAVNFTDGVSAYFNKLNEANRRTPESASSNPAVNATKLYYQKFAEEFNDEEELNILTAFGTDQMMTEVWVNASERAQKAFLIRWSGRIPQTSTWSQGSDINEESSSSWML